MKAKHSVDLLLINPGGRKRIYQGLSTTLSAKEPPIWVGLIAEFARQRGFSVEVLDANALDFSADEAAQEAIARNALLTAVVVYGHNPNASTQVMPAAGEICSEIKALEPETRVLLLGGHVAALPERTLLDEAADFVCAGEGPHTVSNLILALKDGKEKDLARVPDLLFVDGDRVQRNAPAPLITRLDEDMPGIAWDLLPMDLYRAHNWHCFGGQEREPYAALYTTLGCPFTCSFCCIQAPFKNGESAIGYKPKVNSYRRWSPERIVAQIDRLAKEYGIRNIKIADELFVLDKDHVSRISDGLIALGHDLNLWAYARVDTCNDEALLAKMRQAGFRWLAIGIESASEHVRADVAKGYKAQSLHGAIARVRDAGIHVLGNYMFGLPEDDQSSMRATLDFAKDLNTEYANFFSAMAYPGSALYTQAMQQGWSLPASWDAWSQHAHNSMPLSTRYLSSSEVLGFRDAAFQEYFDRPEYFDRILGTFGHTAVEEVKAMIAHPLPRELTRDVLAGVSRSKAGQHD
jgi:radical SAM superfamily enzyme YgiQ (UPF0313 family)